jgi:PAS domain S-box-containing protein
MVPGGALRVAFELAPVGMAILSSEGRIVAANRALGALLGFREPAELGPAGLGARVHPDDRADEQEMWRHLRQNEALEHVAERRFVRPDGAALRLALRVARVAPPGGESLFVVLLEEVLEPPPSGVSARPAAGLSPPPAASAAGPSQLILVADDNLVNQKVARHMLERIGYRADVVTNGREVLGALDRASYDVILMDLRMPEMDGIEATRRIRQRGGRQPSIVAMTALAMEGDRERCLAGGMDDYVSKPIQMGELVATLQRVLRLRAERGEGDAEPLLDERALVDLAALFEEDELRGLIEEQLAGSVRLVGQAREGLAGRRFDEAALAAHTLKGLSAQFGARRLQQAARVLEEASRAAAEETCHQALTRLEQQREQAATALIAWLEREPASR